MTPAPDWALTVQTYIQTHVNEPLDNKTLAAVAGVSISHLHRTFVVQFGVSPAKYIKRLRLKRAGQKLRVGAVDIGAVALSAGYGNHNAFTKAFKKQFGLSPSMFRQLDCRTATHILGREIS